LISHYLLKNNRREYSFSFKVLKIDQKVTLTTEHTAAPIRGFPLKKIGKALV